MQCRLDGIEWLYLRVGLFGVCPVFSFTLDPVDAIGINFGEDEGPIVGQIDQAVLDSLQRGRSAAKYT